MTSVPRSSPEVALLLSCARPVLDSETSAEILSAISRGPDWNEVQRTAELQKITPLLHRALSRTAPGVVPAAVADEVRFRAQRIALRNAALTSELRRLLPLFAEQGVPVITFKGPVLALAAYGNLALRQFADLDILVRPADSERARELLLSQGYRAELCHREWEYHFVNHRRMLAVDLHERLASHYFPTLGDFETLQSRLQLVRVGTQDIVTLSPEDSLLGLCIHLAKDCREWKETLSEVCDIAAFAELPGLDWDRVRNQARKVGGERMLLIALWLARDLLATRLPGSVENLLAGDRAAERLARVVRARLLDQLGGSLDYVRFHGKVWHQDSRFHLGARERVRDKALYLAYFTRNQLQLLLAPSDRDRSFMSLPSGLEFLYYLVRPVRVARDRLRAGPGAKAN